MSNEKNNNKDIEIAFSCECPHCCVADICKNYGYEVENDSINFTNDRLKECCDILNYCIDRLNSIFEKKIFPINLIIDLLKDVKLTLNQLIITPDDLQSIENQ